MQNKPSKHNVEADVILRGYSGWNSRRALEVLDEIFPKVEIKRHVQLKASSEDSFL
ncbi:unnamed protein product [Sphenostylis stenocarpa]|uniref:Uncharacterized protein n=1 Tax=Sphenostylis stenocarpa TaxID=92480 RepID=A0AA86V8L9_9FABA|nr:unnamed protein product [Sphenostylis stenocarpa]